MKQLSHVFQAGLNYSMLYINSGFNHEIGNLLLAKLKTLISIPTHSFKLTISDPVSLIMNYDRKNVNSKKPIKTFPENNSNHPNNFL